MAEKMCQTSTVRWESNETKCPCCHESIIVTVHVKPDGVRFELIPRTGKDQPDQQQQQICNNSLLNIVSVTSSSEAKRCKDHQTLPTVSNGNNNGADSGSCLNSNFSLTHLNNHNNHVSASLSQQHQQVQRKQSSGPVCPLVRSPVSLSQQHPTLAIYHKSENDFFSTLQSDAPSQHSDRFGQSSPGSRFKCEVNDCVQSFANSQQLELHYKEHKGEKIQKCDWYGCNRLFSSKEKLRNHIRCRHTGERPHKCLVCGKAFTSPKHLKDHSLLHTDERPFECDWDGCQQKFRRRHHLVAHKRVHTKERPYNCQFPGCTMKFTKSHHVKRHHETHFKYKSSGPGDHAVLLTSGSVPLAAAVSPAVVSPLSTSPMSSYAFPTL